MNAVTLLKDLFEYNYQANKALITVFDHFSPERLPPDTLKLFNHLLNAHHIWNGRILGEETTYGIWEIHPFSCLAKINALNNDGTNYILAHYGLDQVLQYRNSQGVPFENTVMEILLQVNNHSCYHRGQIAYELRRNQIAPLPTDYILYKRKGVL